MNFLESIKQSLSVDRPMRSDRPSVLVSTEALRELLHHFERLDAEARARHIAENPDDPTIPRTPAAQWREKGEPDPHAGQYDCERARLTLGQYSDDELANGAFMNYDQPLDVKRAMSGDKTYHPPIAWMTAGKDRIRWLSRSLVKAEEHVKALSAKITTLNIKAGDLVICRTATAPAPEERTRLFDAVRRLSGVSDIRCIVMQDTYELSVASDKVLSSLGLMRKPVSLEAYDAGHLNDYGGGNVGWWQDYIRAELERAHDHYQSQLDGGDPS